jgi:hypothetical protein
MFIPANNEKIYDRYNLKDFYATCLLFATMDTPLAISEFKSFVYWFRNKKTNRLTNDFYFRKNSTFTHTYSNINICPWLAWNIFQTDPTNIEFLDDVIADLLDLNDQWFNGNDFNENMWCEIDGHVESVQHNAILFSEYVAIRRILQAIKYEEKSKEYTNKIMYFQQYFSEYFYDSFSGEFCDIDVVGKKMYPNKTAFPYIIWSGLVSYSVAEIYINKNYLNFTVPQDNTVFFDKENLLSYFFLISGLKLYQYNDIANNIKTQCIEKINAEFTDNVFYIYEDGQKIENSSFVAQMALILMLYF